MWYFRVSLVYHYEKTFGAKHNHYVNVIDQYKENGTRTVPQERRCDSSDTIRGSNLLGTIARCEQPKQELNIASLFGNASPESL